MARPKKLLEDIEANGWDVLEGLAVWATEEYCAEKLQVSVDTLSRRIKEEYNCSFAEYRSKRMAPLKANLLKKQYDVAMSGNVSMLIWLGKNLLGQSDKQETTLELDGPVFVEDDAEETKDSL